MRRLRWPSYWQYRPDVQRLNVVIGLLVVIALLLLVVAVKA